MDESKVRTATLILDSYGMDVSVYDASFLSDTIKRRVIALGLRSASEYLESMKADPEEASRLRDALRISYSRFFRDPLAFAVLERIVLPDLMCRKPEGGEIRVWSAGCASGQEAYSIAILLDEAVRNSAKPLRYRIFATDIREESVDAARTGVFALDELGDVRQKYLETCFARNGDSFSVVSRLRRCIDFSVHDLLDRNVSHPPESIFGDFDVVFCSNILYYYRGELRNLILESLSRSLSESGVLFTDAAEKLFLSGHASFQPLDPTVPAFVKRKRRIVSK
jgi:chemotaxis protein methyltransferase CheR